MSDLNFMSTPNAGASQFTADDDLSGIAWINIAQAVLGFPVETADPKEKIINPMIVGCPDIPHFSTFDKSKVEVSLVNKPINTKTLQHQEFIDKFGNLEDCQRKLFDLTLALESRIYHSPRQCGKTFYRKVLTQAKNILAGKRLDLIQIEIIKLTHLLNNK